MATVSYSWEHVVAAFFVNDLITGGNQGQPAIAAVNNGAGYFTTWNDPHLEFVEGRLIGSDGTPAGSEFRVNSTTADRQNDASIAGLIGGNFVVSFTDYSVDPGGDIRARLFTPTGAPVDVDFGVNTDAYDDSDSDVAALADGGFVVTWTRDFGAGDLDIRAQIVNADGSLRGGPFIVDFAATSTSKSQVAGLANGNLAVVWQEEPAAGGDTAVWFRIFDNSGAQVVAETLIDPFSSIHEDIQVVALQDGGFAVAYTDNGWGIDGTEITVRIFNADGSARTTFLRANSLTTGNQNLPTLTVLSNGYILVGWSSADWFYYQVYDPNGNRIGDSFAAATSVVEGEVAALVSGQVANVRSSSFTDVSGDQSIRSSVDELVRTSTGDGTGETLTGDSLRDVMSGNGGNDLLIGLAGNDTLDGGLGNDTLDGGTGIDTASYASAGSKVVVKLSTATAQATLGAGTDTLASIENLIGSNFGDTLTGNSSANVLTGGAGNDSLNGSAGSDTMIGGAGNDRYTVAQAGDTVDESGGDGVDTVYSSVSFSLVASAHVLGVVERLTLTSSANVNGTGNALNNIITGNSGNNTLTGNDGLDTLNGGAGADRMVGGNGNDTSTVDNAGDKVDETGGSGVDTVRSSITFSLADAVHAIGNIEKLTLTGAAGINGTGNALNNTIVGNTGNNTLAGNDGIDTLTGGAGSDTLLGGNGNDKLNGGSEGDDLAGGVGSDSQTGGTGADTFIIQALGDSTVAATGRDMIQDFTHAQADNIDVSGIDANAGLAGNQAFTFIGAVAFSGTAGELRSVVTGSSSIVSGDVNGDAVADFAILVKGVTPLQASDFTL